MNSEPEFVRMLRRMGFQAAYLDAWLPTLPDWTDAEVLDEVEQVVTHGLSTGWTLRDRRLFLAALAEFRGPRDASRRDQDRRTRYEVAKQRLAELTPPMKATDTNVAEILDVSEKTIANWRRDGSIS